AALLIALQIVVMTCLQVILMTLILRWVPARLARDVAAGVAGLTGAALYVGWNLSLRQTFGRRGRAAISNLTSLAQHIDWLPPAWPGHALTAAIEGSPAAAVVWTLATVMLAVLLMATAELLYERTLLSGLGTFGVPRWYGAVVQSGR